MSLKLLIKKSKKLRQDTFNLFIKTGEAHLGGSFSMIEALIVIFFKILKKKDKFILSKSHASFPLYLLLKEKGYNPKLTTHLEIDPKNGIHCTTGSLGHGLPIATGMALARKKNKLNKKIYVLISDGESAEGSVWEALRFIQENNLTNIEVYVNINGYAAYDKVDVKYLVDRLKVFLPSINIRYTNVNQYPFLRGLNAHYHVMSEEDYKSTL